MQYADWIDFRPLKKVLIVKLRHHGDVLLSSPVFSTLKNRYPHLVLDAYIYRETLPILIGNPAIANYLFCDRRWKKGSPYYRYKKELQLLRRIRLEKYDLVINLTEGDRGALAAKFSKCRYAVGVDPNGKGMWRKERCYTHLIRYPPRPRHTVEKNLDALRVLGIFPNEKEKELFFSIPSDNYHFVRQLLAKKGVEEGEYVHIHPVSRWMFKTTSPMAIAEVIIALHRLGKQIVLTASNDPEEIAFNEKICVLTPNIPILNLSGRLSLKDLGVVIALSQLVISVDSLPVHLSSALKKPVVAIFGPTCEQNWAPWKNLSYRLVLPEVSCRPCYQRGCAGSGKSDCLLTLPSKKIIEAVLALI